MTLPSALSVPAVQRELRANACGGRLTRASATSLSLVSYNGELVEVNEDLVPIASVVACDSTANLIDANGDDSGVPGSASTTYGVFLGSRRAANFPLALKLGPTTTFASSTSSQRYLGTSGEAAEYRCLGLVRLNGSTQYQDDEAARFVLNYENQVPLSLFRCPAYNNNNASTTYTYNAANFGSVNAGTADFVEWLSDGYNAVDLMAQFVLSATPLIAGGTFWGIGIDSTTSASCAANMASSTTGTVSTRYVAVPSSGYHKASLLAASNGASTVVADLGRLGSSADPAATFLRGWLRA